jgi:hypothetical protein
VGNFYEIVEGLAQDERIATSGTFLLDSESKLMASSNMMGALGMGGIKMEQAQMGKMDMPGMDMGMDKEMKGPKMAAAKNVLAGTIKKKAGELTLVFSTDPAPVRMGENRIQVTVKDEAGKPVSLPNVLLTFTMPMPGMIPATVPMTQGKQGTYEATVNLGMAGQWDLTITIHRSGHPDLKETFSVTAGGSGMSGMPGM